MKIVKHAVIMLLAAGLQVAPVGCATTAYNRDFDPDANFDAYRTYAWAQRTPEAGPDARGVGEIAETRIKRMIDADLQGKGYAPVDASEADFLVNFYATRRERVEAQTYARSWGYQGYRGWRDRGVTEAYSWTEGSLVVDIVDAETTKQVWSGWAQAAVDTGAGPEQRYARIEEAVTGILAAFPPG